MTLIAAASSSNAVPWQLAAVLAVLVPVFGFAGVWWGQRREGARGQYASETDRFAAHQRDKRQKYAAFVAGLEAVRRHPESEEALSAYDRARADAWLVATDGIRERIEEAVGEDPLTPEVNGAALLKVLDQDLEIKN